MSVCGEVRGGWGWPRPKTRIISCRRCSCPPRHQTALVICIFATYPWPNYCVSCASPAYVRQNGVTPCWVKRPLGSHWADMLPFHVCLPENGRHLFAHSPWFLACFVASPLSCDLIVRPFFNVKLMNSTHIPNIPTIPTNPTKPTYSIQ